MRPTPFSFWKPGGTPFLDSLPLTINCRSGDVSVSGTSGSDTVKWISRPSAGSSGNNSLYRLGNASSGNSQGTLNGQSTLILQPGGVGTTRNVFAYNAAYSAVRDAVSVMSDGVANPSNAYTMLTLVKFSTNADATSGVYLLGMPNDFGSMAILNTGKVRAINYLGSGGGDIQLANLRPAGEWQVLWDVFSYPTFLGVAVNGDALTSGAPSNPCYGLVGNPFVLGPSGPTFTTCVTEVGGVWATNTTLDSTQRSAIMAELRSFTGQPLA